MYHSKLIAKKTFPIPFQDEKPTMAGGCYRTGYRLKCNGFEWVRILH
jgi:hypothetical protein